MEKAELIEFLKNNLEISLEVKTEAEYSAERLYKWRELSIYIRIKGELISKASVDLE